jgi:hypothetical protein
MRRVGIVHADLKVSATRGRIPAEVDALAPLGERVSVSRRTGEAVGPSRYYATLSRLRRSRYHS